MTLPRLVVGCEKHFETYVTAEGGGEGVSDNLRLGRETIKNDGWHIQRKTHLA